MKKEVRILDSTLRDGAQGDGISFSVEDKLNIVNTLDEIGVAFIEAGNPASNPKDEEFFSKIQGIKLKNAQLVAFGSTRRKDTDVNVDKGCQTLLAAGTSAISIFGKCSVLHVNEILKTTKEENLSMIEDTCRFFKQHGKYVIFDAEHFFDGYFEDDEYARETLRAAKDGGADVLALCDTNGGTFPSDIYSIVTRVKNEIPNIELGIHTHNDGGMAVANSIISVDAGVTHVQGTFIGFGERTGNANLTTIIPNLQLKRNYICIPTENLCLLTQTALKVAEIANISLHKNMPFVGKNAFTHKAGMHADGVLKNSATFEHISPESVGNIRRILMSEITGKSALLSKVHKIFPDIPKDSPALPAIIEELKEKENNGYQFEGADGSMELMIRKHIEAYEPFFELISYKLLDERPYDQNNHSATATIKVSVDKKVKIAASDGDGPINALDKALREALSHAYPCLAKLHLIDYKVRVLDSNAATASKVRVLITSTDGTDIWTTVGVSQDIIEASWYALVDSIEYKLLCEKKKTQEGPSCQ